ncbi:MAG TPA: helix-turn-helix domain-containing protein [Gallibacterium anatis]|uniref:Helix-turn-helix domain-containing protein n=1 Tax=Gallibacterium anatis TaxID=750 RepID=A0A921HD31_9PAST|nr:helix-turn-helix domain-containing protein [Gallibacterium anatis]
MSISNRLREVMEYKGLNIKAFAKLLDVPYRTLQNYLLNERVPSVEVLIKISQSMNIDLNWLMLGVGEMFCCEFNNKELTERELNLLQHYRLMSDDMQKAFDVSFKHLSII